MARTSAGGIQASEVQDSTYTYAEDAEVSDSYAITLDPAPTAYTAGQMFIFKANTANTGAASLNVNSLGAKTIKKRTGTDLANNDIKSGSIVSVVYDGTNFQMVSMLANAPAGSGDVSKVGTPVDGQIGVWTGDGTIEGDTALTFDTTTDSLVIAASGKLNFGAVNILTDTAGTTTLANIDAVDATTDATFTALIDTAAVTAAGALMDSEVDADIKTLSLPASTTISAFGATLVDDADAATARTTLDVDQAGTDNSTEVTLAGTPDYITIAGQVITRNQIDLTADVTGVLPEANLPNASTTAEGVVELATSAEIDTGTDATRAVTPDALADSKFGNSALVSSINFVIDGGGSAITTGVKGYIEVPFACTINQVTLLADQSGSIVVDIWKDSYNNYAPTVADTITASAKPTISSATKSQDATLTGWTTSISAGDILGFNVDSITTCQRVTLSLKVTRT